MASFHKSLGLAAVDNYVSVALQVVGTAVMARLLTPQEVGVFAVAAVLSTIAGSMRHFGVPEFLIQAPTLDRATLRAAAGVSLVVSWSFGVALNLAGPLMQRWYGVDGIAAVLHVLSISFFLTPFAAVSLACLRRELRMAPIFASNLAGSVSGFVVGISLAATGHGALSMAWAATAAAAASVLVGLIARPRSVPLQPSLRGARPVFSFGRHASGVYLFGQAGASLPDAIVGKLEGVTAAAHFSRANGLVELFNRLLLQSFWPVIGPLFAQRAREQGELRSAYLTASAYLTGVAWPLLITMSLLSYPAIRLFYGAQWTDSVPLAQVLCMAAAVAVTHHLAKDALLAVGEVKACSRLQLQVHALRLGGLCLGLAFSVHAACWGVVLGAVGGVVLTQRALHRATGITAGEMARVVAGSARVALLAPLPTLALVLLVPPGESNFWGVAIAGAVLSVTGWLVALRLLRHPLWAEGSRLASRVIGHGRQHP